MKKMIFPALFKKCDNGYIVSFPDLRGCITEGDTMENAFEKAQEAMGIYIVSLEVVKKDIPPPTDIGQITCGENESVALINCNVEQYRRNKAVRKSLSIPEWLNDEAESRHLNLSSILQKAIKEELEKYMIVAD